MTNHERILKQAYNSSVYCDFSDDNLTKYINEIAMKCKTQKGVFTVLTTLLVHKIYNPKQDIRYHQANMVNGFSARSFDTKYITPTLKELNLPAMSESGWLTRSLEQPYPYNLSYNGKIGGNLKEPFLQILNFIEEKQADPTLILGHLLHKVKDFCKNDVVIIDKLINPESVTIEDIVLFLTIQFGYKYNAFGGSKLPVIAFHSIYSIMLKELSRYKHCILDDLGSHTASDRTTRKSGDIEIYRDNKLFEVLEIKLDRTIDMHILRTVEDKIFKYNPYRYYILSNKATELTPEIISLVQNLKNIHGCQLIINGLIPSLKYYLRLISDPSEFVNIYIDAINNDNELKSIHKEVANDLIQEIFNI